MHPGSITVSYLMPNEIESFRNMDNADYEAYAGTKQSMASPNMPTSDVLTFQNLPEDSRQTSFQSEPRDAIDEERDAISVYDRLHMDRRFTFEPDHDSVASNKKISVSRAQAIYERGLLYKEETRKKVEEELNRLKSPSKKIPLSKATDLYERGMRSKAERKKEEELSKEPSSPQRIVIPLSKAVEIYSRGIRSREKIFQRIKEAKNDESFSVSKSEVAIPLSRASAIYDRGMQKLREKSRRIAEKKKKAEVEEMSLKSPRKKYSISKGIGIYERGMSLKAELERKRKEEAKKKKWR